jgi:hypothetical protein
MVSILLSVVRHNTITSLTTGNNIGIVVSNTYTEANSDLLAIIVCRVALT